MRIPRPIRVHVSPVLLLLFPANPVTQRGEGYSSWSGERAQGETTCLKVRYDLLNLFRGTKILRLSAELWHGYLLPGNDEGSVICRQGHGDRGWTNGYLDQSSLLNDIRGSTRHEDVHHLCIFPPSGLENGLTRSKYVQTLC